MSYQHLERHFRCASHRHSQLIANVLNVAEAKQYFESEKKQSPVTRNKPRLSRLLPLQHRLKCENEVDSSAQEIEKERFQMGGLQH